jgi:hypothetical protein
MKKLFLTGVAAAGGIAALALTTTAHAQLFSNADATCRSWGTAPGTAAYVQCRIYQDQRRRQRVQDIQRNLDRLGEAVSGRPATPQAQVCFQSGMFTVCQ